MSAAPAGLRRSSARGAALVLVVLAVLVVLVTAALAMPAAVADPAPSQLRQEVLTVAVGPEADGAPVELDATVYTPDPVDGPAPAVLLAHGFGGSKDDLAGQAELLAGSGYVVLAYTARGFGASGGLIHLNSPDYEVADARALIDVLAARDDVLADGPDDPRVGVAGASYGGALALMTAGTDPRVDAVVPAITWNDLSQSLFPQYAQAEPDGQAEPDDAGTTAALSQPSDTPGVFKKQWAALFFASALGAGGIGGADGAFCARFDPQVCALYLDAAVTGEITAPARALLRRHSPAASNAQVTAPTLLLQGEQDSLFPLDEADTNARQVAENGTPVAVRWAPGGHDGGGVDADLQDAALVWFDHHLRGRGEPPGTGFEYAVPARGDVVQASTGVAPDGYPGLAGVAGPDLGELALEGDPQLVVAPPGGAPAAVTGLPGRSTAAAGLPGLSEAAYSLAVLPGASAVFDTPPAADPLRVVGSPRVRLEVTPSGTAATLFATAWVVATDGTPTLPQAIAAPVRLTGLTPAQAREVTVALPASVYDVAAGERVRVVLSSTDQAYALPDAPAVYQVRPVGNTPLALPTAPLAQARQGAAADDGVLPLALGVAAVTLVGLAIVLVNGRRVRHRTARPELDGTPLVVEHLVKTYRDGTRAVDDVSWRAEAGQVVGLLGPNGAGKTTTMRMLVGLIRPESGTVFVLGRPVTPGAAVLADVGALIEGPGFLPHLSGMANLQAFWAATGRRLEEAHVEEALAIAGLGAAVHRPVRSYSHGMAQRLGIAQAMLGLPDLLLLDEPTNGLDPPQIKAMRQVLRDYAAPGRTVVVSSHLLAEVEQTCTHVVVMHRGQVVTAGAVADLVASDDTTLLVLAEPWAERAAALLGNVPGVRSVRVDDDRTVVVVADVARHLLVRLLVESGLDVSTADGRRQLEEVFMQVISGDPSPEPPAPDHPAPDHPAPAVEPVR